MIRLVLIGFILLSVVYVGLSFWSRQMRRSKLRRQWEEEGLTGDREAWIREGLEDYDDSFRRKLILLVYIVPVVLVAYIIYAVNYS